MALCHGVQAGTATAANCMAHTLIRTRAISRVETAAGISVAEILSEILAAREIRCGPRDSDTISGDPEHGSSLISQPLVHAGAFFRLRVKRVTGGEPDFGLARKYLHANVPCSVHPDGPSRPAAEIDRTTLHKGTTVIDPNHHRAASTGVRYPYPGPEAKRPVRRSHSTGIEPFPRCRPSPREAGAIIRCDFRLGCSLEKRERA